MSRVDIDGEHVICAACDGLGVVPGPGGDEHCYRCGGKGETFVELWPECPECGRRTEAGDLCDYCRNGGLRD